MSIFEQVKNWTKDLSSHIPGLNGEYKNISIEDLATIILMHPHTHIEQKNYLNLVYNECTLKIDEYLLYLETKGEHHKHILECTITENGNIISSYHSYKDKKRKLKVPEKILNLKNMELH
jgi:hypothetical protein